MNADKKQEIHNEVKDLAEKIQEIFGQYNSLKTISVSFHTYATLGDDIHMTVHKLNNGEVIKTVSEKL